MIRYLLACLIFIAGCTPLVMKGSHKTVACISCHDRQSADAVSAKKPSELTLACNECHKYEDEGSHHPLSPIPGPFGRTAVIDPVFKLYDGNMECITCHLIHLEDRYSQYRVALVGGPYQKRRGQCFKCHREEVYTGINPHEMMLDENKDIEVTTCLICHAVPPDPRVDRTRDVKFRASIGFLCWRCHPRMVGSFFDKHYLKAPDRKRMVEFKFAEEENNLILPLDFKNRLTCSTCHNPHQPGVIIDKKAKVGAGSHKRLRADSDQKICRCCHGGK